MVSQFEICMLTNPVMVSMLFGLSLCGCSSFTASPVDLLEKRCAGSEAEICGVLPGQRCQGLPDRGANRSVRPGTLPPIAPARALNPPHRAIRLKSYQYHMRRSVGAAKPRARVQKFLRVDRLALDAGLVMQVRTGRAAGGADLAQHLA